MRKVIFVIMVLAIGFMVGVSGAWGTTLTFNAADTLVLPFNNTSVVGAFTQEIGNQPPFNITGATYDTATEKLTITSGWATSALGQGGTYAGFVKASDLYIGTSNGSFAYAIRLMATDQGNVYAVGADTTSIGFTKASGLTYGGEYSNALVTPTDIINNGSVIPVFAGGSSQGFNANMVKWNLDTITGPPGAGTIVIDLSLFGGIVGSSNFDPNNFDFLYSTGECGNSALYGEVVGGQEGRVPLPPSLLLLGSGLAGMCLWRIRRRRPE